MNPRGGNWKVHGCFLAVLLFLLVGGTRAHSNGNARGDLGAIENGRNIENALNNEMIDEFSDIKRSEEDDMVCHEIDDCETCLGNGNCGWCDYGTSTDPSSECLAGNEEGPLSPLKNCSMGLWKTKSCNDDECRGALTCGECVKKTACGWCDGVCTSTRIKHDKICSDWRETSCPDIDCSAYNDCVACADQDDCGWCVNSESGEESCVVGVSDGPLQNLCPEWFYNSETCLSMCELQCVCPCDFIPCEVKCTSDEPRCENFTSCDTCLSSPTENCLWCRSEGRCFTQGSDNSETSCDDVQVVTCDEGCADFVSCLPCTANIACGWCLDDGIQLCVSGGENAPSAARSCRAGYFYDECPTCERITDCDTCVQVGVTDSPLPGEACQWCRWRSVDFVEVESCLDPVNTPTSATCIADCGGFPNLPPASQIPTVPLAPDLPLPPAPLAPMEGGSPTPSPTASPSPSPSPSPSASPFSPSPATIPPVSVPPPLSPSTESKDTGREIMDIVVIVLISLIGVVALILFVGAAGVAFYRYYWLRRHYYLTLR